MKDQVKCEICRKNPAEQTVYLTADRSPIGVEGTYRICKSCGNG